MVSKFYTFVLLKTQKFSVMSAEFWQMLSNVCRYEK